MDKDLYEDSEIRYKEVDESMTNNINELLKFTYDSSLFSK